MEKAIEERAPLSKPAPFDDNWLENKQPCWVGLPFDHTDTIQQIASRFPFATEQDLERGRVLYSGQHQWDEQTEAHRESKGRPTLTFNMFPRLFWRALLNSEATGEDPTRDQQERAAAILALENVDAQKVYNYQHSVIVEESLMKRPRILMNTESLDHVDEHGTIFVKPPRSVHRNWFIRLLDRVTRWLDGRA